MRSSLHFVTIGGADGARVGGRETICDCRREGVMVHGFYFSVFFLFLNKPRSTGVMCVCLCEELGSLNVLAIAFGILPWRSAEVARPGWRGEVFEQCQFECHREIFAKSWVTVPKRSQPVGRKV